MPSFVILTELQQMFFFISVHSLVLTMISGTGSDFWNFAESRFGAVDLQGSPFLWTITFFLLSRHLNCGGRLPCSASGMGGFRQR
jgi:hypothetical protein